MEQYQIFSHIMNILSSDLWKLSKANMQSFPGLLMYF